MSAQVYGDRWEVLRTIGEGGQAHVFEVRDISAREGPTRVLKRLKNVKRLERFKLELEALRRLQHPNVIAVVDHDLDAPRPYLVLDRIGGGTLDAFLPTCSRDPLRALRLFMEICAGVAEAHKNGIVHRDLKPANILLREDGTPVVSDFGMCYIEEGERHTLTEEAVGPRLYMAPELEDGRADEVRPTSDVYSLGKVLYAMLAGRGPFARERHREPRFDLVRMHGLDALEHVNRLLDRMVTSSPSIRHADAGAVLEEIRKTIRFITYDYRALSAEQEQRCIYCGEGVYKLVASGQGAGVTNFGIEPRGRADLHIFVCDLCGHVNLFRSDMAKRKAWWTSNR